MAAETISLSEIANLVQHRKGLDVTKEVSALSDKPIGRGCFCEVYEAIWSCPSTDGANAWGTRSLPVVVKIMSGEVMKTMEWSNSTIWKLVNREFQSWMLVTPHDNVLPLIGVYVEPRKIPGLVAPRVDEPNFTEWLQKRDASDSGLSLKSRCELVLDIAAGLSHLHGDAIGLVHGDLHIGNVFIHRGRAVIADFGLSKLADHSTTMVHQTLRGYLGTYQTVPELAANPYTPRTKQSDIYMFGLIAQYILSIGFTDVDRRYQILRDELQYLGDGCCAKDPLNRPSADDIIVQFRRFKASHPDDSIKARTAADNSPYSRS